ncbi:hypothetical protein ACNS7O_04845 [Haloferacaceae archaeon DSL9]
MADDYRGVFGAFPYAFRRSDSLLFKVYFVVGTLASVFIGLLFTFGLLVLLGETAETPGGTLTLSRSLYVLVGLFAAAPLMAPVLLVARRHRRGIPVAAGYDAHLALSGFVFLASLYVGVIISVPPDQQTAASGVLAPIIEVLYATPQLAGVLPPTLAAVLIYAVHHRDRRRGTNAAAAAPPERSTATDQPSPVDGPRNDES